MKLEVLLGKVENCQSILYAGLGQRTPASGMMQKKIVESIMGIESLCYKRSHRVLSQLSPAKQRLRSSVIAVCKTSGGQAAAREKSH